MFGQEVYEILKRVSFFIRNWVLFISCFKEVNSRDGLDIKVRSVIFCRVYFGNNDFLVIL